MLVGNLAGLDRPEPLPTVRSKQPTQAITQVIKAQKRSRRVRSQATRECLVAGSGLLVPNKMLHEAQKGTVSSGMGLEASKEGGGHGQQQVLAWLPSPR